MGFLSDTSNVLYMQLPEDMTRGTLRVWDPHVYTPKILGIKSPPLPTHNLTLKVRCTHPSAPSHLL